MSHPISVVINYCSNDYRFIQHTVAAVSAFASEIIVPISDRFHDGTREDEKIIKKTIRENPEIIPVRLSVDTTKKEQAVWWWKLRRILRLPVQSGSQYWICCARLKGYISVSPGSSYILFLDADEVVDSGRFIQWLDTHRYQQFNAMKLANYWYFRRPIYQATTYEDSPLLVKNGALPAEAFFSYSEREGMFHAVKGNKQRMTVGADGKPMVHHYGWARTKNEMFQKVRTWGHNKEINWQALVEQEFTHPFNGTDFVQGYAFKKVRPFITFSDL